jgi:hypothetical protein
VDLKSRQLPATPSPMGLVGRGTTPSLLSAGRRCFPSTASRENTEATANIPCFPLLSSSHLDEAGARRRPSPEDFSTDSRANPETIRRGSSRSERTKTRCNDAVAAPTSPPGIFNRPPGSRNLAADTLFVAADTPVARTPISRLSTCRNRRSWVPLPSRRRGGRRRGEEPEISPAVKVEKRGRSGFASLYCREGKGREEPAPVYRWLPPNYQIGKCLWVTLPWVL